MIHSFVSSSQLKDAKEAGIAAASEALRGLNDATAQILFVFSSALYDQEAMLSGVKQAAGNTRIVGASTAGEIGPNGPIDGHSVTVMAISSKDLQFSIGVAEGLKDRPRETGKEAASQMSDGFDGKKPSLAFMFADGLSGNSSAGLRGILEVLGTNFPVIGGSAGDDAQYKKTYQYVDGRVLSDSIVVIGLSGEFKFSLGVKHGWTPIGSPKTVTRAEGAIVYEIDGAPAYDVYKDYFGDEVAKQLSSGPLASLAVSYPLGIVTENEGEYLLRAPFFSQPDGSIVCGGEVPQGSQVQIMLGDREGAIHAARFAGERAIEELGGKPDLCLIFSCHVRDKLFGGMARTADEISAVRGEIGVDTPVAGFYTYAEQAPINGESRNIEQCHPAVHNETIVICLLKGTGQG